MENTIPDFLKEKLINQYGQSEFEKILEGYFINKPVTLRVNTIKSNIQEVKEGFKKENSNSFIRIAIFILASS